MSFQTPDYVDKLREDFKKMIISDNGRLFFADKYCISLMLQDGCLTEQDIIELLKFRYFPGDTELADPLEYDFGERRVKVYIPKESSD